MMLNMFTDLEHNSGDGEPVLIKKIFSKLRVSRIDTKYFYELERYSIWWLMLNIFTDLEKYSKIELENQFYPTAQIATGKETLLTCVLWLDYVFTVCCIQLKY